MRRLSVVRSFLLHQLLFACGLAKIQLTSWEQLKHELNSACHVISLEPSCNTSSSNILNGLAKSWNHISDVRFYRLPVKEVPDRMYMDISPSLEDRSCGHILLIPKYREDRTCLLKPILPKKIKGYLWSRLGSGKQSHASGLEEFVGFVDFVCTTFYDVHGNYTITGQKLVSYRRLLYELHDGPTLLELSEACHSRDLRTFFRGEGCPTEKGSASTANENIPEIPKCREISTLPKGEDFGDMYLGPSIPVIFKKAATSWPAFKKWSNEFLRQTFGHKEVHVKLSPNGIFEGVEPVKDWDVAADLQRVPAEVRKHLAHPELVLVRPAANETLFADFLNFVGKKQDKDSMSAYLEYTSIRSYFKPLENDIDELPFIKGVMKPLHVNIWISNGNTLGKLHFDEYENFLCQIRGRKQVILTDPQHNDNLHEGHILEAMLTYENGTFSRNKLLQSTAMTMSPIDITYPDFEKFPSLRHLKWLNCTIEAGDVLYIPSYWWHEVQSFPDVEENRNLAVNFWYSPFWHKEFPCADCPFEVHIGKPVVGA
uniref:JmjC domain-containing protein n=1 Tax=Trichuris muris TaxID=70415 RepID=A0A5S6QMQ3_TRIMR